VKPKIYCFVHAVIFDSDVSVHALAEDGTFLAAHVSSSEQFAKHDIGLTSERKHDAYRAHYPNGYELEWIDDPSPGKHAGLDEAFAKSDGK